MYFLQDLVHHHSVGACFLLSSSSRMSLSLLARRRRLNSRCVHIPIADLRIQDACLTTTKVTTPLAIAQETWKLFLLLLPLPDVSLLVDSGRSP